MSFMHATKQDSPIQKNKPAKKKFDQATNAVPVYPSGSFGPNAYSGVIQRLKIAGEEIVFNSNDEEKFKKSFGENNMIKKGRLDKYFKLNPKKESDGELDRTPIVNGCFEFAKKCMAGDTYSDPKTNKKIKLEFKIYSAAINEIVVGYQKYLEANENVSVNTEESKIRSDNTEESKTTSANTEAPMLPILQYGHHPDKKLFLQNDFKTIIKDPLFIRIRMMQERIKGDDLVMPKSISKTDYSRIKMNKLRYSNFYSQSAIRDEVKRYLIENGGVQGEEKEQQNKKKSDRKESLYKPDLVDPVINGIYNEHTIHHIVPLSWLTKEYEDRKKNGEDENKIGSLQEYQWQLDNLVLGPNNERRIYEPADTFDCEAADVFKKSFMDTPVKVNDKAFHKNMMIESPGAAMQTDYLQYFYHSCRKYYECMNSTDYKKRKEAPQDLLSTALTLLYRFSNVEIRHRDQELLSSLERFVELFRAHEHDIPIRVYATKKIIKAILKYGRREDLRNGIGW